MDIYNLVSLVGIFGLMAIAWAFSADPRRMNLRVIGWGVGIQLVFGLLVFQALPIIIFVAALMGLLYYWRIMPAIVRAFGWFFSRLMRISGSESLCVASNIFVGIESAATLACFMTRAVAGTFYRDGVTVLLKSAGGG